MRALTPFLPIHMVFGEVLEIASPALLCIYFATLPRFLASFPCFATNRDKRCCFRAQCRSPAAPQLCCVLLSSPDITLASLAVPPLLNSSSAFSGLARIVRSFFSRQTLWHPFTRVPSPNRSGAFSIILWLQSFSHWSDRGSTSPVRLLSSSFPLCRKGSCSTRLCRFRRSETA